MKPHAPAVDKLHETLAAAGGPSTAPQTQPADGLKGRFILGMRVDCTTYDDAVERIMGWARSEDSRYVCVATVNNVIEGCDDGDYVRLINGADLVTPDGMPLVWGLKTMGLKEAVRVYGPDLTLAACAEAARRGIPVGFYGGSPEVLDEMIENLRDQLPALSIAFHMSPPFRDLTPEEDDDVVARINASGVRILFVGLGAPKQERWMSRHLYRVRSVMVGVGAAFDFIAGAKRQAPSWMQSAGLEWVFRLACEPRRLWRRYLYRNPRFVWLFTGQLLHERGQRRRATRRARAQDQS